MELSAHEFAERLASSATALQGCLGEIFDAHEREESSAVAALHEAMAYGALGGGKRLRPAFVLESAALFGVARERALETAAAVELVHCFSLAHDDLPAFDNANTRRGAPSMHRRFGEATATLAGTGLLLRGLALLLPPEQASGAECAAAVRRVRRLLEHTAESGLLAGQALDTAGAQSVPDAPAGLALARAKTGGLFAAACALGGDLALPPPPTAQTDALARFGFAYGVAFQLVDDLDDLEFDAAASESGFNFAHRFGEAAAREAAQAELAAARASLDLLAPAPFHRAACTALGARLVAA